MSNLIAAAYSAASTTEKAEGNSGATNEGYALGKINEAVYYPQGTGNHGALAREEDWAIEMNDLPLAIGANWFHPAAATTGHQEPHAACATITQDSDSAKPFIHHGPSSRRFKKKKGLPKRPLSSYNIFFQKERVRIYEQSSGRISFEELGKMIGQRWKSLDDQDRREYDDLAEAEVSRYRQERDVYDDLRRKTLGCNDVEGDDDDIQFQSDCATNSWLAAGESSQGDSLTRNKDDSNNASKFLSKRAPYLFKPHDPNGPLPHTSLPPGMQVSLRDPDGREQAYKIEYKCFRMTRKDAEEYMLRLNAQMDVGRVK
jgi:hypothetical protein